MAITEQQIQSQELILDLLRKHSAMGIEEICQTLYDDAGMSERITKESILRLREEGVIKPNKRWKMEIKS